MNWTDPEALGLTVERILYDEAICLCPFHNDHRASASFNMESGLFYCFACGTGGTEEKIARITGGSIVRVPASSGSLQQRSKRDRQEWEWALSAPSAVHNEYLKNRGILPETILNFGIRDVGFGVGVIFHDRERVAVGCQIRREFGEPRYLTLGRRPPVWPLANLEPGVFVVEGIFGVFKAWQAGYKAVATMSASVTDEICNFLLPYKPVVVFDNDAAGYKGAAKLVMKSGARVVLPGRAADEIAWDDLENWRVTQNVKEIAEFVPVEEKRGFYRGIG